MLGLELVVEPLRDAVDVEGGSEPTSVTSTSVNASSSSETDGDVLEALNQRVARLRCVESVVPAGEWLARLRAEPTATPAGLSTDRDR